MKPRLHITFLQRLAYHMSWKAKACLLVPLVAMLIVTIGVCLALLRYTLILPHPVALRSPERSPIVRILARDGSVLAERGAAHEYVPLEQLPAHVAQAVIATEDRRFYEHWGIDPWGLARAILANLRAGRYAQGGSTLSQQLAKNLFLTSDRRLGRKIEELLLALWLEVRLRKPEILEIYLNRVYFGAGAYGIEAAARRYFDKSARELTLTEAAVLAGLLKAPSRYAPSAQPGYARARARMVLAAMLASGFIDGARAAEATAASVRFAESPQLRDNGGIEYLVDFVLDRLPPLIGAAHREVIVETTFDAKLQRKAQETLRRIIEGEGERQHASQASLVVVDLEGGVRALVGGRNWADSQFNRALRASRQPGSSFKPFVFLAALEKGWLPDTTIPDLPLNVEGWSPKNDGGGHRGIVTLRQALALSINTVAVRLQMEIGTDAVIAVARRLGIRSALHKSPSLALGTAEVTLMELTSAYVPFATGGLAVEPYAIRRVKTGSGRVLYVRDEKPAPRVISPEHSAGIVDMLASTVSEGTARRAQLRGQSAAGKTGTTQDYRDAWYVGFTGHLLAGVWVGNDSGFAMSRVSGGSLPARLWHDVMLAAHEGLPAAPLKALAGSRAVEPVVVPSIPPVVNGPALERVDAVAALRAMAANRDKAAKAERPPVAPAPVTAARPPTKSAPPPGMPTERIDSDFIARQLETAEPVDAASAATEPRPRPEGMMSLGVR